MNSERPGGAEVVVGPSGETLTIDNLPVADTGRWTMRRKAQLIAAVRGGLMTKKEACDRCGISAEELDSWQTLLDQHGLHGLKATSLQKFRGALDRRATPSVDAAARRPLNRADSPRSSMPCPRASMPATGDISPPPERHWTTR